MTDNTLPQLLAAIQNSDDGDFLRTLAATGALGKRIERL